MSSTTQTELLEHARQGDREAFGELYEQVERPLSAFLYRMIGDRKDAEDLAQEAAIEALEGISQFPNGSSFRAWVFRLALRAATEYLKDAARWDPEEVIYAGRMAAEDAALRRRLRKLHRSRIHTTYQLREQIDFCFTAVGLTLPPAEKAALLLTEVHDLPAGEAAQVFEVPQAVVEHRRQQARQALIDAYQDRCQLINRNGACSQCADLDTLLYGDRRHTELALFQIPLDPCPTAEQRAETLTQRLAIVRAIDPLRAEGAKIHECLMEYARQRLNKPGARRKEVRP